jgi:hypothetical protein
VQRAGSHSPVPISPRLSTRSAKSRIVVSGRGSCYRAVLSAPRPHASGRRYGAVSLSDQTINSRRTQSSHAPIPEASYIARHRLAKAVPALLIIPSKKRNAIIPHSHPELKKHTIYAGVRMSAQCLVSEPVQRETARRHHAFERSNFQPLFSEAGWYRRIFAITLLFQDRKSSSPFLTFAELL